MIRSPSPVGEGRGEGVTIPMPILRPPILCLVTDHGACRGRPLEEVVRLALSAGVGLVQLRARELPARQLLEVGRGLLGLVRSAGAYLVVNDRLDVALALGADGVHLGTGSLPVNEVRRVVGNRMLVGASVHSLEEAVSAEATGADYLLLGTIFETPSHPGCPGAGVQLVSGVAERVAIPVIAIGGVNVGNAPEVMAAGAAGIAVIRAIQSAPDVAAATRVLVHAITGRSQQSEDRLHHRGTEDSETHQGG